MAELVIVGLQVALLLAVLGLVETFNPKGIPVDYNKFDLYPQVEDDPACDLEPEWELTQLPVNPEIPEDEDLPRVA